jgi:hypothetical protein
MLAIEVIALTRMRPKGMMYIHCITNPPVTKINNLIGSKWQAGLQIYTTNSLVLINMKKQRARREGHRI